MIMKADANISIKGGARVEVKNITGIPQHHQGIRVRI